MITTFSLSVIGLTLNMIGVILAFIWGHPQPDHSTSISIGVGKLPDDHVLENGETYGRFCKRLECQKRRYLLLSRMGLVFMFFGFAAQLASLFV